MIRLMVLLEEHAGVANDVGYMFAVLLFADLTFQREIACLSPDQLLELRGSIKSIAYWARR